MVAGTKFNEATHVCHHAASVRCGGHVTSLLAILPGHTHAAATSEPGADTEVGVRDVSMHMH